MGIAADAEELAGLDATALAERVRRGELSPRELVAAAIARAEKVEPALQAIVTPLFERALEEAEALEIRGPFPGVPFVLKDLMCSAAGHPHYRGSRALRDAGFVATEESHLAERFRAAGLVAIARTKTPEFGFSVTTEPEAFGPARNPWNTAHSTGGSSGGSAALVAARVVPLGHANDGGGSIRIPASECGLVGLKPSRGRVSLAPTYGEAWHGLVSEGAVTLTVRDTAGLLDAVAGPAVGDPYAAPPRERPYADEVGAEPGRLRVGLLARRPGESPEPLHPECAEAAEATGRRLEALGHAVETAHPAALDEASFGADLERVLVAHAARTLDETGELLGRELGSGDVEAYTWELVERGRALSAREYVAAAERLQAWSRRVARWWAEGFDLLVTPTIAAPPPPLGWLASGSASPAEVLERVLDLIPFTPPFNVTGQPAVSLPLHWSPEGLPVGVQLVAAYGREDLLLRVAAQLERAAPWWDRLPPHAARGGGTGA